MKLITGMVTNTIDGESFAIATGRAMKTFKGLIRNNSTAAYIFELLKTDQTEDSIVAAMLEKYDAPEEVIRADVREILDLLREKKLIEE